MSNELWKDIPGFDGYQASTHGRIRSYKKQGGGLREIPHIKKLTKRTIPTGLITGAYTMLCENGVRFLRPVHRLVLETFVGPRPEGMEGCHYDGNPLNNRLENLRWDTPKGNGADSRRYNRIGNKQRNHFLRKLNGQQRRIIRWHLILCALEEIRKGSKKTQREIARKYKVGESQICRILRGKYKIPDDLLLD